MLVLGYTLFVVSGCTSANTALTPALRKCWEVKRQIILREVLCKPPRVYGKNVVEVMYQTHTQEDAMMMILPRQCKHYPIWFQNMVVTQGMVKDLMCGRALFQYCTFDGLELDAAAFTYVFFKNCSFKNARFNGTSLQFVRFKNCDLTGAYFDPEIIDGATKTSILHEHNILESDVEWFIEMRGHDVVDYMQDDEGEDDDGEAWKNLQ